MSAPRGRLPVSLPKFLYLARRGQHGRDNFLGLARMSSRQLRRALKAQAKRDACNAGKDTQSTLSK